MRKLMDVLPEDTLYWDTLYVVRCLISKYLSSRLLK